MTDDTSRVRMIDKIRFRLAEKLRPDGLKRCPSCKQIRLLTDFPLKYDKTREADARRSHCQVCERRRKRRVPDRTRPQRRKRMVERRRAAGLDASGKPFPVCESCGKNFPPKAGRPPKQCPTCRAR